MKFARREARRGNLYDGIILDPPAYGHGPDGEKWKLDECLFEMLRTVSAILKPHGSFMVLNLYSNGYSAALGETLVREAFGIKGSSPDVLTSGELALNDKFGKVLPLSIVVRLER
jgi:23S rRNA (cytosine1962-C5)-methyltransferase